MAPGLGKQFPDESDKGGDHGGGEQGVNGGEAQNAGGGGLQGPQLTWRAADGSELSPGAQDALNAAVQTLRNYLSQRGYSGANALILSVGITLDVSQASSRSQLLQETIDRFAANPLQGNFNAGQFASEALAQIEEAVHIVVGASDNSNSDDGSVGQPIAIDNGSEGLISEANEGSLVHESGISAHQNPSGGGNSGGSDDHSLDHGE